MGVSAIVSARHLLFAVITIGFGGFVAFHTALLFSGEQPMVLLVRQVWIAGLGLILAFGIYQSVGEGRAFQG